MSDDSGAGLSRRQVIAAGTTGLLAASVVASARAATRGRPDAGGGTPEQVHLTWGDDPTRSVVVSWGSAVQAVQPRVRIGQRVITAQPRSHSDPVSGEVSWTYHALVTGLRPGATYGYAVCAGNDRSPADPFSATFSTAPAGRAAFRFTSFGDLAGPPGQAVYAAGAVEAFQPLFHLLNGGLAATRARGWRDFANSTQASAANRPWMPVPGAHEVRSGDDEHGLAAYLVRYRLPANGLAGLEGRWYAFRAGTVLFVALHGDDVAAEDAGAVRGYSGGAQTRWLESALAAARADPSVDWVVVQVHQCACSSSRSGNGSEQGIREAWLPLFDRYEVDLVLSGHDHGYERSFPVRGFALGAGPEGAADGPADARRPRPVTTVNSSVFDTSQGTVYLVLGGADADDGADADADADDGDTAAIWSARRVAASGHGIAVFDVDPGSDAGGQTSITTRYYRAPSADPVQPAVGEPGAPGSAADYSLLESFTLVRPRSDGRRWHRPR